MYSYFTILSKRFSVNNLNFFSLLVETIEFPEHKNNFCFIVLIKFMVCADISSHYAISTYSWEHIRGYKEYVWHTRNSNWLS